MIIEHRTFRLSSGADEAEVLAADRRGGAHPGRVRGLDVTGRSGLRAAEAGPIGANEPSPISQLNRVP